MASESFVAASERFGYTGSVKVYDTYADAVSGKNPRYGTIAWPQRDGSLFSVRNRPSYYTDFNSLLTNWSANGGASPSNTNNGFMQMYDDNADNWQNQKAWWNRDLQTFTVEAKGRNATYPFTGNPGEYARLWNAGAPAGSGESTRGTFLRYEYSLTATGLNAADGDNDGFYTNMTNPTGYTGYFKGIFRNESLTSPLSNGFYVFDLSFNNVSWAASNGYALPDEFGSNRINNR